MKYRFAFSVITGTDVSRFLKRKDVRHLTSTPDVDYADRTIHIIATDLDESQIRKRVKDALQVINLTERK